MAGLLMSSSLPCSRSGAFASGSGRPVLQPLFAASAARSRTPLTQAKLSKAADFRDLSHQQIQEEVQKCKRALFDLRLKQATRQELKTSDFPKLKLKVAQLLTVAREKEIADGLTDRREWRRKEKAENILAGFPQF